MINYAEKFEACSNKWMHGNILVKRTKVSIRQILRELSESKSFDTVLKSHSDISIEDINNCLSYAAELVGSIDLKKSMTAINSDRRERQVLADRLESLKIKTDD